MQNYTEKTMLQLPEVIMTQKEPTYFVTRQGLPGSSRDLLDP